MPFIDLLLGRPLASREEGHQKVGPWAGLPMLGLDGLASAAYGPEAALTILIPMGAAGIAYSAPIIGVIVAILFVLFVSYRQTIAAYPNGGGSYTVARENLGTVPGLIAAAALLLDYVLVVAVGISAGVGALVSAVPSLQPYILDLGLVTLGLIALVNLRGVRESGVLFALPTYLFVLSLGGVVLLGVIKAVVAGGHPTPVALPPALPRATEAVSLWLLLRAFASGCTAMTGVEAVSNGVAVFREPTARNAQRTLAAIVAILAILLLGIAYLATAYRIGATDPLGKGYESVVSQLVGAVVGKGPLYYVTIGSTLVVLALSANTGFADFPRLCRLLAKDDFLPHAFAQRGRRLVFGRGIAVLTGLSAALLIAFGGITDRLIPLFAIGAFLAFTLSQAGMVVHWRCLGGSRVSILVNGLGAVATAVALVVVLAAKFVEGAWITALLVTAFVLTFLGVRRHYDAVRARPASRARSTLPTCARRSWWCRSRRWTRSARKPYASPSASRPTSTPSTSSRTTPSFYASTPPGKPTWSLLWPRKAGPFPSWNCGRPPTAACSAPSLSTSNASSRRTQRAPSRWSSPSWSKPPGGNTFCTTNGPPASKPPSSCVVATGSS